MILSFEEIYYEEVENKRPDDSMLSDEEMLMIKSMEALMKNACKRVYERICADIAVEMTQ